MNKLVITTLESTFHVCDLRSHLEEEEGGREGGKEGGKAGGGGFVSIKQKMHQNVSLGVFLPPSLPPSLPIFRASFLLWLVHRLTPLYLPPSIPPSLQATVWLTQHSFPHSFIPFPPRPLPPSLNPSLGHRVAHAALTTKPGHFCDLWSRGRAGALAVVRREGGRTGGRAALFILPAASFPYLSTFHTAPSLPPSLSPSLPPF